MSVGPATRSLLQDEARHAPGLWAQEVGFVRGEGARLYDADGRAYLDFAAGIGVASLGHAHPRLTAAIAAQAARLVVCPQGYANDVRTEFLARLCELAGGGLTRAFLCSSGAEANEAALKWARAATGRTKVVAARRGFAGRTLGALAATWEPRYREPYRELLCGVEFVPYGDVEALAEAVDQRTAAVVLEPVQGEGGVNVAPKGYLAAAREATRAAGALLVLDEVQCGSGRTGRFLASHHDGVGADAVTLAKGLAGGVPIGATLMTDEVAGALPRGGHGTTFGGNPLACAAGLVVLDELTEGGLMANAAAMGERLLAGLRSLVGPRVREARGRGLMVGLELRERAAPVVAELLRRGLVTVAAGPNVVRFLPPLNVSPAEVDEALAVASAVLAG